MPVVSVIIVTRNTCTLACAAIQSVLDSRDAGPTEIILVDNGSTDQTPQIVPQQFPSVLYVRSDRNLGFAGANNHGAKHARGEFILLLNSDARLKPGSLAQSIAWMRSHPQCGIVGAQLLNPDGSRQNSIANFPSLATELLNKSLLRRLRPGRYPGKEHAFAQPVQVESVIGAFMLIRNSTWQELGGFNEQFFFFFEETDLCLRASCKGWQIHHLPQVEVWHEQGGSARQIPAAARIEYWRSRYIYFRSHSSALPRTILSLGLLIRLSFDWLFSAIATLFTLGQAAKPRHKFRVTSTLWLWHLRGCPRGMGLPRQ